MRLGAAVEANTVRRRLLRGADAPGDPFAGRDGGTFDLFFIAAGFRCSPRQDSAFWKPCHTKARSYNPGYVSGFPKELLK